MTPYTRQSTDLRRTCALRTVTGTRIPRCSSDVQPTAPSGATPSAINPSSSGARRTGPGSPTCGGQAVVPGRRSLGADPAQPAPRSRVKRREALAADAQVSPAFRLIRNDLSKAEVKGFRSPRVSGRRPTQDHAVFRPSNESQGRPSLTIHGRRSSSSRAQSSGSIDYAPALDKYRWK